MRAGSRAGYRDLQGITGNFRKKNAVSSKFKRLALRNLPEQGISLLCGDWLTPGVISDAEIFQIARFSPHLQERRVCGSPYIASMKLGAGGIGGSMSYARRTRGSSGFSRR
jgi:hypothetical protein